jgi:signal transduction histidine kinase/CheY-like chemotaxis protein/HPt (histidine-containing phosphotransfer) domain-containing protein
MSIAELSLNQITKYIDTAIIVRKININTFDYEVTFASQACQSLLGIEPKELLACGEKYFTNIKQDNDFKENFIKNTVIQKSYHDFFQIISNKKTKWIYARTYQIKSEGEHVYTIEISEDATQIKLTEKQLLIAKKAAEKASEAKSSFLANMSHEIRTPISGIVGLIEMTLENCLQEETRNNLELMKSSAKSLLNLINDILDFSKIEANKIELIEEVYDFHAFIHRIISTMNVHAQSKNLELRYHIDKRAPRYLIGDSGRLQQILHNLLSNAIKFTEYGTIKLDVMCKDASEQSCRLSFSVIDEGIGLPEDFVQSLFQSFNQLNPSVSKKYGGTGLGLAISKRLVELMDGTIKASNNKTKGATFSFEINSKISLEKTKKTSKAIEYKLPKLKILVAEDNILNQRFIHHCLAKHEHEVTIVNNGKEVLENLSNKQFDLILMDVQMPELDGLKTTEIIRNSEENFIDNDIPIIALTAYAMKGERERFIESGMNAHVAKPVDKNELFEAIHNCLNGETIKSFHKYSIDEISQSVVNIEQLKHLFKDEPQELNELISIFMANAIDKFKELEQFFKSMDKNKIVHNLHFMAGSASTVKASRLGNLCTSMETLVYQGNFEQVRQLMPILNSEVKEAVQACEQILQNERE